MVLPRPQKPSAARQMRTAHLVWYVDDETIGVGALATDHVDAAYVDPLAPRMGRKGGRAVDGGADDAKDAGGSTGGTTGSDDGDGAAVDDRASAEASGCDLVTSARPSSPARRGSSSRRCHCDRQSHGTRSSRNERSSGYVRMNASTRDEQT